MKKLTILLWVMAIPLSGATFTVINTADSGPGSLRWGSIPSFIGPRIPTHQPRWRSAPLDALGYRTDADRGIDTAQRLV